MDNNMSVAVCDVCIRKSLLNLADTFYFYLSIKTVTNDAIGTHVRIKNLAHTLIIFYYSHIYYNAYFSLNYVHYHY